METNQNPFFSIVIPTKNRPILLRDAIESVLLQDFEDFELIVSDNFNEQETQDVIASFSQHPKFHSIRTDTELNMIDHWEFATKHASGEYVIVLADRKVLYQSALKKIAKTIKKYPKINTFSFGVQTYDEIHHKMGWNNSIGKTQIFETKTLITNLLKENYFSVRSLDIYFPKTLNGCYRNAYASELRREFGNYFNTKGVTTPDYSSFIINCALNQKIVYIGEKLILTQGEQMSNGRIFGAGKFQNYMDKLGLQNPYIDVRIKAPLIYNLLHVDFFCIQKHFKRNIENYSIDLSNYYRTNYYEILMKSEQGLDSEGKLYFEKAWFEAIKQDFNEDQTHQLINEAKIEFSKRNERIRFDFFKRFKYHFRDYLSIRFSEKSYWNKLLPFKFNSVFQAAGFKTKL